MEVAPAGRAGRAPDDERGLVKPGEARGSELEVLNGPFSAESTPILTTK